MKDNFITIHTLQPGQTEKRTGRFQEFLATVARPIRHVQVYNTFEELADKTPKGQGYVALRVPEAECFDAARLMDYITERLGFGYGVVV